MSPLHVPTLEALRELDSSALDEDTEVFVESVERTFVLRPVSDLQITDNITIVSARGGSRLIPRTWRG